MIRRLFLLLLVSIIVVEGSASFRPVVLRKNSIKQFSTNVVLQRVEGSICQGQAA